MLTENEQKLIENLENKLDGYMHYPYKDMLEKAFEVADHAHQGQQRYDNSPYITHPIAVAEILAELQLDLVTVVAGLLHDVVEDTEVTIEDIERDFGEEVAELVDGITKLSKLNFYSKEDQQAENLRKMFLAMAKDIRVILIKLADRLHNMRTLDHMNERKQIEKAYETLEIYAPLAHRLGINRIKWELEDLSFRYLKPEEFYDLVRKVNQKRQARESFIENVIKEIREKLNEVNIKADIIGRPKHLYSIYNKMQRDKKSFDEIYDLMAIRIIVDSVKDCYGALGVIHSVWRPIPGRFKDYIAMQKPNMYQSLHTTVIGDKGIPFEIQIRTYEMNKVAEYGIAAHWKYKQQQHTQSEVKTEKEMEEKLAWLREMLEWQRELKDSKEFVKTLKMDLFEDEVFVFSPKGDVYNLPAGATPIDFAYKVHTQVGHRCAGAKVNGKIVPLTQTLRNGDIVQVITGPQGKGPSRDWLNIAQTTSAKNKIRQWFKKEKKEENIENGLEMLETEAKRLGYRLEDLIDVDYIDTIFRRLSVTNKENLYETVGYGGMTANQTIQKLITEYKKHFKSAEEPTLEEMQSSIITKPKTRYSEHGVVIEGVDNAKIKLAKCCNPINGDPIIGYITRGGGVSVHRKSCPNMKDLIMQKERIIHVEWEDTREEVYQVDLIITAIDRVGLINDIIMTLNDNRVMTLKLGAKKTKDDMAIMNISVQVTNKEEMEFIIGKLSGIRSVAEVSRTN